MGGVGPQVGLAAVRPVAIAILKGAGTLDVNTRPTSTLFVRSAYMATATAMRVVAPPVDLAAVGAICVAVDEASLALRIIAGTHHAHWGRV